MSRPDNDRLGDIIGCGRRMAAIADCGRDRFEEDWTLRVAATHEIEQIVEAATRLSNPTLARLNAAEAARIFDPSAAESDPYSEDYSIPLRGEPAEGGV